MKASGGRYRAVLYKDRHAILGPLCLPMIEQSDDHRALRDAKRSAWDIYGDGE